MMRNKLMLIYGVALLGLIGCANNSSALEKPGVFGQQPPAGKYSTESGAVWEEPAFFDDDGGTAAEVPM